jgi:hypothetical protein
MRSRRLALVVALAAVTIVTVVGGVGGLGAALTPRPSKPATESVLLIGDSLMHQAATGIAAALPGSTVVDEAVPGSGLLDGNVDWLARARQLVDRYRPDVVVVSFVGNYDASQGSLVADTPEYYAAWADASQRLTDQLRASGARVDWVAQPPLRSPNFYGLAAERTAQLDVTYATLARRSGVALLDADAAVSTPSGDFTAHGTVCGKSTTLRINDGVHFTATGASWWGVNLGRAVGALDHVATADACGALRSTTAAA